MGGPGSIHTAYFLLFSFEYPVAYYGDEGEENSVALAKEMAASENPVGYFAASCGELH